MSRQHATAILDAAERWKQRCLLDGASLFTDERLWRKRNFDQLRIHFVENPDEGSEPFYEKLQRQLGPATPEAKRLWSEMTWAYYLIASNVTPRTKRDQIARVWEWSGARLPENHWALADDVLAGCANTGAGYLAYRWREQRFIVLAMNDWFSLSRREREAFTAHAWKFAGWLADRRLVQGRQFRHALLFLLFPDSFEPIVVGSRKREIVRGFARDKDPPPARDDVAIDRLLLETRQRLEDEDPGESVVDFFRPPFVEIWKTDATPPPPPPPVDLPSPAAGDDEAWFRHRFGEVGGWVISPGVGAGRWLDFQQRGIAAIDYKELGDLSGFVSREAIHETAVESGLGDNPSNHSLALWSFAHTMRVGDVLIAKRGRGFILGWGTVTGEYLFDPDRADFQHVRRVEWHPSGKPVELPPPDLFPPKTLTKLTTVGKGWVRRAFPFMSGDPAPRPIDVVEPYDIHRALKGAFIPTEQFSRSVDALAGRKNLILQGPPGVGKTWIAKRLAWCLIGRKDPTAIEMVQFHQSYAYEDFVQGWRPNETGGFTLRNGVFFEFCKRAEARPDAPFVFIIDEITGGTCPGSSASC